MKGKSPANWLGMGAVGGVLLIVLGFASYQNSTQTIGNQPVGAPFSVSIPNPQPGSQFEVGSPVAVFANASGPSPVISMELWVDGEMAQVLSAPGPKGLLGFQADYIIDGLPIGVHSLFVRAIGPSYETKASPALPIEIVAKGEVTIDEATAAYVTGGPSVPAAILAQNAGGGAPYFGEPSDEQDDPGSPPNFPNPEPPPPPQEPLGLETEIVQAKPWSLSVGDWFTHLFDTNQSAPAAPGIPASAVEVCTPRIWISDNSDNEDGFYVYRRDPGTANFLKIATLEPYEGPVFTFDDEEVYGSYEYYVGAFNGAGEAASNIETVEVDSENCKPDLSANIAFDLASLFGDQGSEMSYCYYSLDGIHWLRHPAGEQAFMDTALGGPDTSDPALGGPDTFLAKFVVHDSGQPMQLSLDCWAWHGGGLTQVGTWHFDDVFADNLEGIEFETLDAEDGFTFGISPDITFDFLAYDPRVPIPVASIGSGNQVCGEHTGYNFILVLVCADIADDLDYAYWDLGECPADLCFNASDVIGYNVYDTLHNGGLTPADTIDDPISLYFMINGQSCDPRHIRVSALVEYEGELLESFPSNQVFYNGNPNCDFLFGLEPRTYRITLDTIDFSQGNIDDGADAEDDFELYGHVVLRTSNSTGHSWNMPVLPCSACQPDIEIHEVDDDAEDNPYNWADFFMYSCDHDSPLCYETVVNLDPKIGYNSNVGTFELFIGEMGWIDILLSDEDSEFDDAACHAIHAFTFDTYAVDSAPNQTLFFEFSQFDGDEDCVVNGHIELIQ